MATTSASRPSRVIVVAFGPRDMTSEAVRRARRLVADGGKVTVVAAHRDAMTDPSMPVGAGGLRDTVGTDAEPVVVLHDDVRIGREGVHAMLRAWRATGHPVVPWSNVAGASHDVDEVVPADDDARGRMSRRLALRGGRAAVSHPICVLADGATLRSLAGHFMTVADAVWRDPGMPVTTASKALAHHAGRCRTISGIEPDPGRPLLVASMIVRDEADRLPGCLASLDGLVDRIEICDTGSTDATVAIAEAAGAHVIHREWRDDFAWARNEVLDRCRDAVYALQIDADERVRCDDPEALRRRLALLADSVRVFTVPIDNLDDAGRVSSTHRALRVLRTDRMTYRGALHERPLSTDSVQLLAADLQGLRLEHHGYRTAIVAERGKADRNVAISARAYEESPNWETAFQYARSLSLDHSPDLDRIHELLHEVLAAGDVVPVTWRAWALGRLGRDALQADDDEAALELAQEALRLVPADPVAGAVLTEAAERLGRTELIVEQRTARRSAASPAPFMHVADARSRVTGAEIAALLELGQTDEAFAEASAAWRDDPRQFRAWPALVRSVAGAEDSDTVDDLLVAAALGDPTGGCVAAVSRELPPGRAARLCARYLASGGDDPAAVRNGLATAVVAGDGEIVRRLLADAHRVEPAVLERLAAVATRRGMAGEAELVRAVAGLPRRRFVVCATARSATGFTATALTALGHRCGHEEVYGPYGPAPDFGELQGDSSWLALPHLDGLPDDAVILHQVRDPLQVLRSLMGVHMLSEPSPYLDFIAQHAPEVLAEPDELTRCVAYWVVWNRRLMRFANGTRPYVRYRIEDLDPAAFAELTGLLGSLQPVDAVERRLQRVSRRYNARVRDETITMASLPDGALTAELRAMAREFGYQLVAA